MSTHQKCASLRQTVRQKVESIRESYIEEAQWCQDFPWQEIPNQKRVPITKEFMAMTLAAEANGEEVSHPAKEHFRDALHDSIVRLVGDISSQYSRTCADETDDLMQDCMLRIWKKIGKYNEERANFSTWVYHVCRSVLNRKYHKTKRHRQFFVPQGESLVAPKRENTYGNIISHEFADAVKELAERFPEKKDFIYEVFGNPETEGYVPPRLIRIVESARNIGMKEKDADRFYSRVVRPFMRERFKHERSDDGQTNRRTNVLRGTLGGVRR